MRRQAVHALVALALMGLAGALVAAPASTKDVPLRMDFEAVPDTVAGWRATAWSGVAALPPDPRAPRRLTRAFEREGRPVWTMVEYYPSQESESRAAARELVFPGRGWSQIAERRVDFPAPAASGRAVRLAGGVGAQEDRDFDLLVPGILEVHHLHLQQRRRTEESQGDERDDDDGERHRDVAAEPLPHLGRDELEPHTVSSP
jgi:hypothetical protein